MKMKPEGRVKREVKRILDAYKPLVFYRMPVLNGMGLPSLDFYGCHCGLHFEIETKAGGKDLTPRQIQTAMEVETAGGKFFAITSLEDEMLRELDKWLHRVAMRYKNGDRR